MTVLLAVALNAGGEPRRVLLIHSFGQDFEPFTTFSADFRFGLARESSRPVDFFDIALTDTRFKSQEEGPVVDYIGALFAGHRVDLVVPMGSPAVHFAQKYRSRLFPDTPMILGCVDPRSIQGSMLTTNDAVVAVHVDPQLVVESILRLLPETTNVVFVFGASPLEKYWANEFMREGRLPRHQIGCESFSGLSFERMKQRAAVLPPRSVMLYGPLLVDADGVPLTGDEVLPSLHAVANAPMFGINDFQLGQGIVGGPLIPLHELALQTVAAASGILKGESPASFRPPPMEAGAPMYDWRELRRWNVGEERLPAGSVIRYRTPTVWERYWLVIITGVTVLVTQAVLIAVLNLNLRRRRKAERSLRESEERIKLAAEAAQLGMWEWDLASNKVFLIAQKRNGTGTKRDTPSDYASFMSTVHPADKDGVAQAVAKAINGDGNYEHVNRQVRPGGQVRWISVRARVEFDAVHRPVKMRGVGMDITARKMAEEQAKDAQAEAELWQRELAHELNQPLAAIVLSGTAAQHFMAGDRKNDEEMRAALDEVVQQGQRAAEIIAGMRGMLNKDPGKMAEQNVNQAVKEVLQILGSDLVLRGVTSVLRLDPRLPVVKGYAVQLRQVLLNLVVNACDAMADVPAEARRLTIQSRAMAEEVEVSLTDSGPGFSDEMLRQPFEPFRTTKAKGLGLGLTICRSIINTHGGHLAVANNNGDKGATVRFTLPMPKEI